jgi:hypothetical protein
MTHLDEERLVALCFGDGDPADSAHAASCASCTAAADRLRAMLAAVEPGDVPERGDDYGRVVWERLQERLEAERRWTRRSTLRRRTVTWGALAASLLIAFLAGREFPKRPVPPVAEAIPEAARERILLLAVGDHLERSQVLLVELINAGPGAALDVPAAQESAEALVSANRLYRASATQAGDAGVASVLEELERVLVEVAHQGPDASAKEMERIRKRIEDRGILFKIRVIESQVRERGNDGRQAPPIHSKVTS